MTSLTIQSGSSGTATTADALQYCEKNVFSGIEGAFHVSTDVARQSFISSVISRTTGTRTAESQQLICSSTQLEFKSLEDWRMLAVCTVNNDDVTAALREAVIAANFNIAIALGVACDGGDRFNELELLCGANAQMN